MAFDPIKLRVLAEQKDDENWKFRDFLKRHCDLKADELDERVFELTKKVWAGIDCTTCANCCREVRPTFSEEDVDRLSQRLGVTREKFIADYLEKTEPPGDNPWQTRTTPCPFLKDNRCSVYDDRPDNCRGYPYLYEPDIRPRLIGMLRRTFICPIVYDVMEELKKSVGFRYRRRG